MAGLELKSEAGDGPRPLGESIRPLASGWVRSYRWRNVRRDIFVFLRTWIVAAWVAVHGLSAQAVIFYSTADPEYNTTAPPADLAGADWALQGVWVGFAGTPVAEQYFITAKHVGAAVGTKFSLGGTEYPTTAFFDDPGSDIRICKIRGRFPAFAPLYLRTDEVGKSLVVFGRGTQRGGEVTVDGPAGPELKGWLWGTVDGRLRWGENLVGSVVSVGEASPDDPPPSAETANFLRIPFNPEISVNAAHLSIGDSGGGVFIQDGATWKLAGVNWAVDGPYNTTDTGFGFQAAIFDERGLYRRGDNQWQQLSEFAPATPGAFYASRVSARSNWISSVLSRPASDPPFLQSAAGASGPFVDETEAIVDELARKITLPQPAGNRFYRLNGAAAMRITAVRVEAGRLVCTYE